MLPRLITCAFERLGLRGAPTILRALSLLPALRNQVATVTLPSGTKICFPAYDHYWCRYLYAGAPYEPDVEAIFRKFGEGRTLIDCGANIGFWSARHKEFGFTQAIAIEASPVLIPYLRANHPNYRHAAVHSVSGEILFLGGEGAWASIGNEGLPVQSLALSDLKIDGPVLVKLDVEGSEIPAIEGAEGLDAIFVYEDWPGMPVTQHLLGKGYSVTAFDETDIRSPEEGDSFNARTTSYHAPSNFVASARNISPDLADQGEERPRGYGRARV